MFFFHACIVLSYPLNNFTRDPLFLLDRQPRGGETKPNYNPAGFEPSPRKNQLKPGSSAKFKEAVPKAKVLEQPLLTKSVFFVVFLNGVCPESPVSEQP
jgi:hypothetical protein